MDDRLYRSRTDRMITGVAGGLAERMDVDPSLVRVIWVLLAIFSGGVFALIYLVMAVVVPERPAGSVAGPSPSGPAAEAPAPGTWIGPDGEAVAASASVPTAAAEPSRRPGAGAIVVGGVLVVVGAAAFMERFLPQIDTSMLWPIVVIALGIGLVALAFLRPSRG
ncbi:MAG TPA: PspC domain-containing protein [Candidatus Limnocylindrales bacterium]|nr:PspC domain-containing protein [Candidatus Limnocylindrales bacterium]